ncbi:DNA polymerase III subunit chi [Erythrobacter litoralis]|uniref:DNA polymerase III chi subunit n=1 Tax=Erythrobacter litoralis (strain HTCC2594) TaxID=314225 RepID=Q2N8X5_ERYLH|nr:DNA polymerase III subunit chi [Erythrobacter litoralis]ABC63866.1 DNA polymerase III chi subunit [Erythrobacter litoralis HTCC2594]
MKADFWQLSRDPADKVVAMIAARVLDEGERLLVVAKDDEKRAAIAKALWEAKPEHFLANGEASADHAERQPILLGETCEAANGASHVIFADGEWRDPHGFERAFLLFSDETLEAARATWRALDGTDGLERSFFRQEGGKWTKVA